MGRDYCWEFKGWSKYNLSHSFLSQIRAKEIECDPEFWIVNLIYGPIFIRSITEINVDLCFGSS